MNGSITKTSNLANFYGGDNLWPETGWKPGELDKPDAKVSKGVSEVRAALAPEYAEIDNMATFSCRKEMLDSSGEGGYASASVITARKNRKNKVSETKFLSLPQCMPPLLKGGSNQQAIRLSQDVINNTDCEEKNSQDSKRPFFIETTATPLAASTSLPFASMHPRLASTPKGGMVPHPHRLPRNLTLTSSGVSPYSINPFNTQPYLLHKGVTLALRELVPPPPSHPPPPGQPSLITEDSSGSDKSKALEELPYGCYSATRVASPRLHHSATSGDMGSYAGSSNTYQSIEGLMEGLQQQQQQEEEEACCVLQHRHSHRCSTSSSSCSRCRHSRPAPCHHHHHAHRHHHRHAVGGSGSCNTLHRSLHSLGHRSCCSQEYSIGYSSPPLLANSPTPYETSLPTFLPQKYRPNFYGPMSPPLSPMRHGANLCTSTLRRGPRRMKSLESDALLHAGGGGGGSGRSGGGGGSSSIPDHSVYGGSVRSDVGTEDLCGSSVREGDSTCGDGSVRSSRGAEGAESESVYNFEYNTETENSRGSEDERSHQEEQDQPQQAGKQSKQAAAPPCSSDSSAMDGGTSDAISCGSCEETTASFYAACDKQTKL